MTLLTTVPQELFILMHLKSRLFVRNPLFICDACLNAADNLLLRKPEESTRLVLIDFGLAVRASHVPSDVSPTGGQTQWSPEKAASEGYGFPADLWAAIAVFVHMLSGSEPWSVRFRNAGFLHYIVSCTHFAGNFITNVRVCVKLLCF